MWVRWQILKPIVIKELGGNENVEYQYVGSLLGRILQDQFGYATHFASLKGDEVVVELKDASGSGLKARWKLTNENMTLIVQDFERIGQNAARILARKEGQDAL